MNIPEIFGSMLFNDSVMKERLSTEVYKDFHSKISKGEKLTIELANQIADAMKNWALEKGVTHFTHWFQPMTGVTAEKHDSFISPTEGGGVIMKFSGKSLVQGEPDASSFPSGGLRATFEARGYTAWDPTSYAFIKDGTLCIPTAFCSYGGHSLDKKTPLLRSMEAVNRAALRILKLFPKNDIKDTVIFVGAEQEYFLIDKKIAEKRSDIVNCGRTIFGARPPKGQELEDHYFGAIKPRVQAFMRELDTELWKLGVLAKTEHNEAAPGQHELAPIYATTNIATDQNQITMELMKSIAARNGLMCLLHEKPFAGVNGSGKHNNWSIGTENGINLLEPGETPEQNARFLLFLVAVIKAVDENQDLLRLCVASAGNDHRLGANEAPPAIVSMFLGDELTAILEAIENDTPFNKRKHELLEIGVTALPNLPKDSTDRNRTSPFAFTGNKFEFRMPGSALSVAEPNIVLNTIVAEALSQFADELEGSADFTSSLNSLIKKTLKMHKHIIFNGNNYSDEWVKEAKERGLLNLRSTIDAVPYFSSKKNVSMFEKHKVLTKDEILSRTEILYENYCHTLHIEALTMINMTKKEIIPSVITYEEELLRVANSKKLFNPDLCRDTEEKLINKISILLNTLNNSLEILENSVLEVKSIIDNQKMAKYYRETIFVNMAALRNAADVLESITAKKYWSYPTYEDLLYSVK